MWPKRNQKAQYLGQSVPFDVALWHWTVKFDKFQENKEK